MPVLQKTSQETPEKPLKLIKRRGCPPGGWPSQKAKKEAVAMPTSEAPTTKPEAKPDCQFTGKALTIVAMPMACAQLVELDIENGVVTAVKRHDEDMKHLTLMRYNKRTMQLFIMGEEII